MHYLNKISTLDNPQTLKATQFASLPSREFAGIAPDVLAANVEIIPDVEYDPLTKEVLSTPRADLLDQRFTRFTHQARPQEGAYGFFNEDGSLWHSKHLGQDSNGKRTGNYIAPTGIGDVPYRPNIPNAVALNHARRVSPLCEASWLECEANGGLFWDWVKNWKQIPIIVTEGAKKALAAISQGCIALSLYGCDCGQSGGKIKPALLPYVEGRKVFIGLDQDPEPDKRARVNRAIARLTFALKSHAKALPLVMEWDSKAGKGLDDVIATNADIFHLSIAVAINPDRWRLKRDLDLSPLVSLRVNNRYLGDAIKTLPPNKLIAIDSFCGTGKTEWLSKYVLPFLMAGGKIIIPPHREQLAKELGTRFGIEYRTELTKEGKIFGYALCIDSLHPNANPRFHADDWEICWVILDEADQVFWHLLNSSTCERNRTAIANEFAELCNQADKIFLMSSDLTKADIDFIQGLLIEPVEPFVIINDWRPTKRACTSYQKPQELFAKLLERIGAGEKLIIHTGGQKAKSKWGTINLERMLHNQFPKLKILRIDSNSVAEPGHPAFGIMGNLNAVLSLYDIVIASPTLETGISIEGNHFGAVFCFASGSQTVDAIGQSLERYRANVPRYIWATDNACYNLIAGGSTSPYGVIQGMTKLAKLNQSLTQAENYCRMELDSNAIHLKTWAIKAAYHNLGFRNYRDEIHQKLRDNGYDVRFVEMENTDIIKEIAKNQAKISHAEYCQKVADSPILEDREYKALQDKGAKTEAERLTVDATAIANKYATDTINPELVDKDSQRGWYSGLRLQYALTVGAEFTKATDQNRIISLAENNGQIFPPDFNKKCLSAKVEALKALGIPALLDGDRQFTKADPDLVEWHQFICPRARDIKTYLNISINPDPDANRNSPIDCLRKFLKLFALELTEVGRETTGEQVRQYRISMNPDGRQVIFDRWLKRDQEKAKALTLPTVGDVFLSVDSTDIDMPTFPISICIEKNRDFSHINNCTSCKSLGLGNPDQANFNNQVNWDEIIANNNKQISKLGWDESQASQILQERYGQRSRLKLTDAQLFDWIDYCQSQLLLATSKNVS
ncbi:plasmid replication protein, CyRepA1 family [Synechocystis salina]|uniref:DUF3854 domain-containing protein n=1 Tax=Synechocystis salina LEGE 00031 TaxID=1828736 RepID=A0ABR9VW65_9SYNC|nr:plasmid replication protein, CyRepA1 family [Synechocystis salina]MBE9242531.1 DUF3854 domain-containing protein [Synechocystis salina LEGE 00041]MBE9255597.1 DUF3854 domain-containing protein [Synechocystis salina LEGE 00031]